MTPKEIADQDLARAMAERCRAVAEYNIMMGTIEDPQEEEEEDTDNE